MKPIDRLDHEPELDDLVPTTDVDHLLPEEQRPLASQAREAFADLGREMDRRSSRQVLYSVSYEGACHQLAAGRSHDDIRAQMTSLADTEDAWFGAVLREAYEDALAGRPPRDPARAAR